MTEQGVPYQEKTDTSAKHGKASVEGIPESRDILLFLVVFDSALVHEPNTSCWHVIGLGDGSRGFCQRRSSYVCPCCGFSMCDEHQSDKSASFPDETGVLSEEAER